MTLVNGFRAHHNGFVEADIKPNILRKNANYRCGAPEAGSASELNLVMNHEPADHNLVTWMHQLEVGEKSCTPGTVTSRDFSCCSGGGSLLLPFAPMTLMPSGICCPRAFRSLD